MERRNKLLPSRDPECEKYKNDPERIWYDGNWRTAEGMERRKARSRERHKKLYADPERREKKQKQNRERIRKLRANPEYRERQNALRVERRATDPEFREKEQARQRKWHNERYAIDDLFRLKRKQRESIRYYKRRAEKGREYVNTLYP